MADGNRDRVKEYRQLLLGCSGIRCESVFQQVADRYEDDLLEFDDFPDEYFDLALDLLSSVKFYSKPGVWNFLLVLSTEQDKLQHHHYEALVDRIVSNYGSYKNNDLCLAVCDFIARNYSVGDARRIFQQLALIESNKPEELHGFVKEGLIILTAEDSRAQKNKH
jgi:hypothetical protein